MLVDEFQVLIREWFSSSDRGCVDTLNAVSKALVSNCQLWLFELPDVVVEEGLQLLDLSRFEGCSLIGSHVRVAADGMVGSLLGSTTVQ